MGKNILIIVAHPDDELIGMGGTMQKLIEAGHKISILMLAKTGNARGNNEHSIRINNFNEVTSLLGIANKFYGSFPDTGFDSIRLLDIIKNIEEVLEKIKPNIIYTHFYNDLNIDHCIASKAVLTAIRPYSKFSFVKEVYLFEVLSTTEHSIGKENFIPNYFEVLKQKYIEKKKKLLEYYKTEIRKYPYPLSKEAVEILAKKRGLEIGEKYVEAFILYRKINN